MPYKIKKTRAATLHPGVHVLHEGKHLYVTKVVVSNGRPAIKLFTASKVITLNGRNARIEVVTYY